MKALSIAAIDARRERRTQQGLNLIHAGNALDQIDTTLSAVREQLGPCQQHRFGRHSGDAAGSRRQRFGS